MNEEFKQLGGAGGNRPARGGRGALGSGAGRLRGLGGRKSRTMAEHSEGTLRVAPGAAIPIAALYHEKDLAAQWELLQNMDPSQAGQWKSQSGACSAFSPFSLS